MSDSFGSLATELRALLTEAEEHASDIPLRYPALRAFLSQIEHHDTSSAIAWYRHKIRKSLYQIIFREGVLQTDKPLSDNTVLLTYMDTNGRVWHRTAEEFHDGRFEPVP